MSKTRKDQFQDIKGLSKELRSAMQSYIENPMDRVADKKNYERVRRALVYILSAERCLKEK